MINILLALSNGMESQCLFPRFVQSVIKARRNICEIPSEKFMTSIGSHGILLVTLIV